MNAPSNLPAERKETPPLVKLATQLEQRADEFKKALPSHISPEKLQRTIVTAAQSNPELLAADRQSLIVSAMKAAQDGLLPDGREAALVIFSTSSKDAQGNWQRKQLVQYMPMVYGLRKKIVQSGEIVSLQTGLVYRAEVEAGAFIYEVGMEPPIRHRPMLDLPDEALTDDQIVAAYSLARMKDGSVSAEVMRRGEINKVREASQTGATRDRKGQARVSKGPWADWFGEMARKTVMRRHSKTLPMSGDVIVDVEGREFEAAASAAHLLDAVDGAKPVALPNPEELETRHDPETGEIEQRQTLAEHLDDEIPTKFDKDTGEITEDPATGMTEVTEEQARALDAGNDGTLSDDNPTAAEGPADEQRGEPERDEKPAWFGKVQWIRSAVAAAKNKQHLKDADDEFSRIRAGLPDEVIAELDGLISARRRELSKPVEGAGQ
jgi:recombination protein RecT